MIGTKGEKLNPPTKTILVHYNYLVLILEYFRGSNKNIQMTASNIILINTLSYNINQNIFLLKINAFKMCVKIQEGE